MTGSELFRAVRRVGIYSVAWTHGVPEAVEEAVTDYLLRHPHLVPHKRVAVVWDETFADEDPRLFRTLLPEPDEFGWPILAVTEIWWALSPGQRETAFVDTMLVERLLDARVLRITDDGDLEALIGDKTLSGAAAEAFVHYWADYILAEHC